MQVLETFHKWLSKKIYIFCAWLAPRLHPDAIPETPDAPWEDHDKVMPPEGVYWFCYKYPHDKEWAGPLLVEVKNGAFGEIPHIGAGHWMLKMRDYRSGNLLVRWYWTYRPQTPTE